MKQYEESIDIDLFQQDIQIQSKVESFHIEKNVEYLNGWSHVYKIIHKICSAFYVKIKSAMSRRHLK